ncbi:hypothetical protein SAMN05216436_11311 [bacterium A37T11]|nr:hypothetical protein SAMN05216436_11311 [bacterium A37T11]
MTLDMFILIFSLSKLHERILVMTRVLLHIENKKKWNAIKTVLEAMDIDYATQQPGQSMEEGELDL